MKPGRLGSPLRVRDVDSSDWFGWISYFLSLHNLRQEEEVMFLPAFVCLSDC